MSFTSYKSLVEVGDTLFIYLSPTNIYPIKVEEGQVFQTKYGALRHSDLIGLPYGSLFNCAKGFVHILHPTPELWTLTLPHRTQILYSTDISFICTQLDLKSGSVVCEAGTGSGSLSHAIARTIAPNGHLFTFDFHEDRVSIAAKEFAEHGLSDVITVTHRDVCSHGFGYNNYFDALFLDLPHPWTAIKAANEALKTNGGRICCFSPCIEQVQKTCVALKENHFYDIDTYECLLRPYEVKEHSLPVYQFSAKKGSPEEKQQIDESSGEKSEPFCGKKLKTDDPLKEDIANTNDTKDTNNKSYVVTYSPNQTTGHTGFLTIGVKYE